MNSIKLHKNVTEELLIKNNFKKLTNGKYGISKVIYKPLLVLKIDINLNEQEINYDVIDRNTQTTYYPFWNNVNGENNLVANKVVDNFNEYINELQDKGIIKIIRRKNEKRHKNY